MKWRWRDAVHNDKLADRLLAEDLRELLLVIATAVVSPGDPRDQHLTEYLSKRRTRVED